jgi:hypothetical protein
MYSEQGTVPFPGGSVRVEIILSFGRKLVRRSPSGAE